MRVLQCRECGAHHPENHNCSSCGNIYRLDQSSVDFSRLQPVIVQEGKAVIDGHTYRVTAIGKTHWYDEVGENYAAITNIPVSRVYK